MSQLMKENLELRLLIYKFLPKRRMSAANFYIFNVNVYEDHIPKKLVRRTTWKITCRPLCEIVTF